MSQLRVHAFSISIDGYGAGPNQSLEHPLGVGGKALHEWVFATRTARRLFGAQGGETGIDDDYTARGFENVGAWILGRNMFGPVRGPWPDDSWRGWWGEEPPYHTPVYVLTHHPRAPLTLSDTTFHFVTDGIESALRQARAAAGGKDVRLGGGVQTIREYLKRQLIDQMHVAVSPVALGAGESLFGGIDVNQLGYQVLEYAPGSKALHVVLGKKA